MMTDKPSRDDFLAAVQILISYCCEQDDFYCGECPAKTKDGCVFINGDSPFQWCFERQEVDG